MTSPTQKSSVLMPWAAIFAFPILGLSISGDLFTIELAPLIVTLSVLLGFLYGGRGLAVVLASGLFLIPDFNFPEFSNIGVHSDLWIVSVLVCIVASSGKTLGSFRLSTPMSNTKLALYTNLTSVIVGRQMVEKNGLLSEIASGFVELNLINPTLELPK